MCNATKLTTEWQRWVKTRMPPERSHVSFRQLRTCLLTGLGRLVPRLAVISIPTSQYGESNDPGTDRHHQDTSGPVCDRMLFSRFLGLGTRLCADASWHHRRANVEDNPANY